MPLWGCGGQSSLPHHVVLQQQRLDLSTHDPNYCRFNFQFHAQKALFRYKYKYKSLDWIWPPPPPLWSFSENSSILEDPPVPKIRRYFGNMQGVWKNFLLWFHSKTIISVGKFKCYSNRLVKNSGLFDFFCSKQVFPSLSRPCRFDNCFSSAFLTKTKRKQVIPGLFQC